MTDPARAARLTAIAEKCERNNDSLLAFGNDYSDVLLDAANALREVSAHVETLTQQVAGLEHAIADQSATFKKAEQQRDAAHAALREIEERDGDCLCEHDDEDCCVKVEGVEFCARCFAHAALAPAQETERGR